MGQGNVGQARRGSRGRALAVFASWMIGSVATLVACSAGVDDFYILEDGARGGTGGATASGGRSDQSGGRVGKGGSGGSETGGAEPGGAGGTDTGGAGNAPSSGGSSGGDGGTANTGGSGDGGTANTGGSGDGGTTNTGGTNTGGTNTGGTNTGGTNTGGTNTGGTNTGGTGGTGTGGTTPLGTPVVVTQSAAITGITTAAWDGRYFWLLAPAARGFYRLDPQTVPAAITGPFALPGTNIAARVFGVSATHVFVIADAKAYKVPRAGDANATGVAFGAESEMNDLIGAYAGGYLLVGHAAGTVNARAFKDDGTLPNVSTLGKVTRVATDGNSFAIARANVTTIDIHRVSPPSFALNPTPCTRGSFTFKDLPISVSYSTVAWAAPGSGARPRLVVNALVNGVCAPVGNVLFGVQGTTGHPLALLDGEGRVIVAESFAAGSVDVTMRDVVANTATPETNLNLGGTAVPREIIAGGRYAVIVGSNAPVLVRM